MNLKIPTLVPYFKQITAQSHKIANATNPAGTQIHGLTVPPFSLFEMKAFPPKNNPKSSPKISQTPNNLKL